MGGPCSGRRLSGRLLRLWLAHAWAHELRDYIYIYANAAAPPQSASPRDRRTPRRHPPRPPVGVPCSGRRLSDRLLRPWHAHTQIHVLRIYICICIYGRGGSAALRLVTHTSPRDAPPLPAAAAAGRASLQLLLRRRAALAFTASGQAHCARRSALTTSPPAASHSSSPAPAPARVLSGWHWRPHPLQRPSTPTPGAPQSPAAPPSAASPSSQRHQRPPPSAGPAEIPLACRQSAGSRGLPWIAIAAPPARIQPPPIRTDLPATTATTANTASTANISIRVAARRSAAGAAPSSVSPAPIAAQHKRESHLDRHQPAQRPALQRLHPALCNSAPCSLGASGCSQLRSSPHHRDRVERLPPQRRKRCPLSAIKPRH